MKYNKDIVRQFETELEMGMTRTDTCTKAGISYETFTVWMERKPDFSEAVKRAEARCKERCIKIIQKAAISTWTAAAWWLERRHRDEYSLRTELTGPGGKALTSIPVVVDKQDTKL